MANSKFASISCACRDLARRIVDVDDDSRGRGVSIAASSLSYTTPPMDPFLVWLEATPLSVWIRESTSVLAFPGILSAHAIGMGLAAGINVAFALHVLGVVPGFPARELRHFVPVMWFGFWLNAASGLLLLIAYPTKALTNPVFYLKLLLIALAMGLFIAIRRLTFHEVADDVPAPDRHRADRKVRLCGAAALACWAGAITAGRLLAYTYSRLSASW